MVPRNGILFSGARAQILKVAANQNLLAGNSFSYKIIAGDGTILCASSFRRLSRHIGKGDRTMRIAVASTGPTLDDNVSTEFGHSKYLLIVDFDTLQYEVVVSPVVMDSGPAAGRLLAEQLLEGNVSKLLVSHINLDVLKSFLKSLQGTGIQIIDGMSGTVHSVVRQFRELCMADTIVVPCKDIIG
jgi:predicted Fe-Mo cluster-binding NifX family protein